MPFSFHGFGPAAILIMLACVLVASLVKSFRERHHSDYNHKQHHS